MSSDQVACDFCDGGKVKFQGETGELACPWCVDGRIDVSVAGWDGPNSIEPAKDKATDEKKPASNGGTGSALKQASLGLWK